MNGFGSDKILKEHKKLCFGKKPQNSDYPKPGQTTKCKNAERLHEILFVVYADFVVLCRTNLNRR
jgi:hypothetical protein